MQGSLLDLDGDGQRWKMRVYLGRSIDGKILQRSKNFRGTRREAQAALRKFIDETTGARHGAKTVRELIEAWWAQAQSQLAPSTLQGYRRKLDHDILPAFGRYRIDRLTPALLDRQYRSWRAEGLAPATVRQLHAILCSAFRQAYKWGWLDDPPTKRASPPALQAQRRKAIGVPELQALITTAEESDGRGGVLVTAIVLGALLGARRGELCAMRWSDWDADASELRVARSLTVVTGKAPVEGPTKTHQERTLPVDPVGRAALLARRLAQEVYADLKGRELVADPFVLSRCPDGSEPCLPDGLTHAFKDLAVSLGQPWHFHDLRHFVATRALASGANPRTVADRLGHADPSVTLRVYAHAVDEASRELAGFLGGLLAAPGLPPAEH